MSNGIIIDVVTNTGDYSLPIQIIKIDENEQPIIVQPVQSFTDNLLPVEINVDENHQPIFIQTSEYYAPVQSVNGKIGFVTITLDDFIENVVYTTGDQTISGLKTFTIRPTVNGTGILLSGEATAGSVENVVYTTGDQTISGIKIFATGIDIFNATSPQRLRIFNSTGINSGEFATFGWQVTGSGQPNALVIGTQATQSGTLRDLIITGNNINISSSGNVQFNNRPTVNGTGVLLSGEGYPSNNPSGFITGIVKQTKLFDYSISGTNTFTYIGSALVGSSQNSGVWKIYRSQIDQNGIVISNLLAQNIAWTGRFSGNYM